MDTSKMSIEEQLAALQAENAKLKENAVKRNKISFKVGEKGGLSVYGNGRFPTTLYASQWERLLAEKDNILAFIAAHADQLVRKE